MREELSDILKQMRQAANAVIDFPDDDDDLSWEDNEDADKIDSELKKQSEGTYRKIATEIVDISSRQLKRQNESKNNLKRTFTWFFMIFIAAQYVFLVYLLLAKGYNASFGLNNSVIVTYITSVFVETLGAIIIMIKYAFDSKQEVNILKILNGVISNYQKFKK